MKSRTRTLRLCLVCALLVLAFGSGGLVQKYVGFGNILPVSPSWRSKPPRGPTVEDAEIFLLAGQSNMSGAGQLEPNKWFEPDNEVFLFRDNRLSVAEEPINPGGVGPGLVFAKAYRARDSHRPRGKIVVVPVAHPGTNLRAWLPSNDSNSLYARMIRQARAATYHGTLTGLLFFQGESDATGRRGSLSESWDVEFSRFVKCVREDLKAPDLPIVFAQIGPDPGTHTDWARVQRAQSKVRLPNVEMIQTEDLTPDDSRIHFTADSYIEIGQRFAAAMSRLIHEAQSANPDE